MDHDTRDALLTSAEQHILDLQKEIVELTTELPDPKAKRKLKIAKAHLAEHQKDLQALKKSKPVSAIAFNPIGVSK